VLSLCLVNEVEYIGRRWPPFP